MSQHAFVDESYRPGAYLLTAVGVDPAQLRPLRRAARAMLLPGQREVHLAKEPAVRRRQLLDGAVEAGVTARVYTCGCDRKGQERARATCLTRLVDLIEVDAHRLVLDSRAERDLADDRTIRTVLGARLARTQLTYEHAESSSEALIWFADMLGWAYGAGQEWRTRVQGAVVMVDCGVLQAARSPAADRPRRGPGSLPRPTRLR